MTLQKTTTALILSLVALCLFVACGQDESAQEQVQRAQDAVQEEFDGAIEAARKGAVADAARKVAEATEKATEEAQKKGAAMAAAAKSSDVVKQLEDNVENSVKVGDDAYAKARTLGATRLEAAGDAYDAVDETHEK